MRLSKRKSINIQKTHTHTQNSEKKINSQSVSLYSRVKIFDVAIVQLKFIKTDDWHRKGEKSAKEIQQEITNNTQTKYRKLWTKVNVIVLKSLKWQNSFAFSGIKKILLHKTKI